MRNCQFVFAPKIEYQLVAERSEANQNSLTFPTLCVFTVWLEPILSKTPERNQTKEASPATARSARHTTEKYSLLFSFCARRISFSPNEKSIFLWCFALTSKAAGLTARGKKFPPPNPLHFCPLA